MDKTLYLVGGAMGVGKTAACQKVKTLLPHSVFLDGDWCWDAHPFLVTKETRAMVMDNITHLLNNFLHCSAYENVIFCWVMDRQAILDDLLSRLDTSSCRVCLISLLCDEGTLTARLEEDIAAGCRTPDVIPRSLARLPLYEALSTHKIDTSTLTVEETARAIAALSRKEEP